MRGTSGIGRIAAAISGALWLGATSAGAADDVGRPLPDPVAVDVPAAAEPAPQPDPEIEAAAQRVADEAAIAQASFVAARLATRAPRELYPYFDLYLYVSKAARGLWAQRMFVFRKDETNTLVFEETFAVSTGRERHEQYFTWTPPGIFALDPNRFYRITYSAKWRNAAMPWAMFLDYSYRTKMSGVALHAATRGLVKNLGKRASGGCVRLPPDRAESLFGRIQANFRGRVPVFAFDEDAGTTNREGRVARDSRNAPLLKQGYRVLLIVDDFGGPEVTAALANTPGS